MIRSQILHVLAQTRLTF